MSHPLAPKLTDLSDEELVKKLTQLHSRLNIASRTNHHLANQIFFLIDDYQAEYTKRLIEKDKELLEEMGEDFFSEKINIE